MTEQWTSCPAGCGRQCRIGHLLCAGCWREVPRHLQMEVHRTWLKYRRLTGMEKTRERRQARVDYQAARDAALASIR